MWIAAISDLHGSLPPTAPLKRAEAVIIAGDVGPDYNAIEWFNGPFSEWARAVEVPIYMTWGNHDFIGFRQMAWRREVRPPENIILMVDSYATLESERGGFYRTHFSPWSPKFMDWAFMMEEEDLLTHWQQSSSFRNCSILVSHTPPLGYCDRMKNGMSVGSTALREMLPQLPAMSILICGHIHEGYGAMRFNRDGSEPDDSCDGWVINVALMDERYNLVNPITFINLEGETLADSVKRVPLWDTDGDTMDWMPVREERENE